MGKLASAAPGLHDTRALFWVTSVTIAGVPPQSGGSKSGAGVVANTPWISELLPSVSEARIVMSYSVPSVNPDTL